MLKNINLKALVFPLLLLALQPFLFYGLAYLVFPDLLGLK